MTVPILGNMNFSAYDCSSSVSVPVQSPMTITRYPLSKADLALGSTPVGMEAGKSNMLNLIGPQEIIQGR